MTDPKIDDRQKDLEQIVSEALEDPNLSEALEAYEIGEAEYVKAIAAYMNVQISSGTTTNPVSNK